MYKIEVARQAIIVKIIPNSRIKIRKIFEFSSKNPFRKSVLLSRGEPFPFEESAILIDRPIYQNILNF